MVGEALRPEDRGPALPFRAGLPSVEGAAALAALLPGIQVNKTPAVQSGAYDHGRAFACRC